MIIVYGWTRRRGMGSQLNATFDGTDDAAADDDDGKPRQRSFICESLFSVFISINKKLCNIITFSVTARQWMVYKVIPTNSECIKCKQISRSAIKQQAVDEWTGSGRKGCGAQTGTTQSDGCD